MSERPRAEFSVVGIGASAGGLEALRELLQALPPDTGLAFVIVQHLAPSYPSALAEILSRATTMPVREVHDEARVQANHVYVIPPGRAMTIAQGTLHLLARETHGPARPVDQFFRSLAEEQAHQAIGVVLSGTATDGTLGLEAIKAEGGITFAQDETAQQTSMPRSAIAAGCVDFVLPPHEIAQEIGRIARHPYVRNATTAPPGDATTAPPGDATTAPPGDATTITRIFHVLQRDTGVDFAQYKANTLMRRLMRRVILHQLKSLPEYLEFLESNPSEVAALYQDLLIGVTSFFRDPDAFAALQSSVMPRLFQGPLLTDSVRIWVVGCSTGEEAYSLAMALTEVAEGGSRTPHAFQIFATDLNGPSIEKARAGVYPKAIAQDVSPERLRRFFVDVDGHYRVTKAIRDRCVFARHNVLVDPPFSRVDLISCRNLLIYMEGPVQQQVVATLHYALKPQGVLWLGGSETLGAHRNLFEVQDTTHKIFTKRPWSKAVPATFPVPLAKPDTAIQPVDHRPRPPFEMDVRKEAERFLLGGYAPPGVLISGDMEIRQVWGDTGPYLAPAPGQASLNLLKMMREGLLASVRSAVLQARSENRRVRTERLRVKSNGGFRDVTVEVIPLGRSLTTGGACLVVFEDDMRASASTNALETAKPVAESAETDHRDEEVARITRELSATREYLQDIIEQQEAANEELQTAHEEAQSANEELQSINEELETSKEEIQSTNEELATVNDELNHRNRELGRTINDLTNLLASVEMAIVMLGPDLRVRRYTPLAENLFNLIPADVGRLMRDVQHNLDVPELPDMLARVLDSLIVVEREVKDRKGRRYLLRIRPYKTLENQIDGAVVLLVDIDSLKRAHEYADAIVATARAPLLVLDGDLRVRTANRAFYDLFEVQPVETEGRLVFDLGNGQWNIPELRRLLEEVLPASHDVTDFRVTHRFERIGRRVMQLNARRLLGLSEPTARPSILLSVEDVTERHELEQAYRDRVTDLAATDRAKDEFLAMLAHELRNPLGSLRNALQVVQHRNASAPTVAEMWNVMDRQVGHLARLVDDLLDVARLTRGQIEMRKRVTDLTQIVRQAIASMNLVVAERAQELTLSVSSDVPLYVDADATRLEQVFGNLVNNASKFNHEGGHVWVTIETEPGGDRTPVGYGVVRVRDDGLGIDPAILPRVFDLFAQADQSLARSRGGLGIGLTIVRRVIEQHGGRVEARSAGVGQGSEFRIRLPLVPPPDARRDEPPAPAEDQRLVRRVLVVDDSADGAETLAQLLRADGHDVRTAADGPSALSTAEAFRPDVALLDIGLPGMTGYELATQLRQLPNLGSVLLVALTGYGQDRDRKRAVEAGFDHHLTKPIDHQTLRQVLGSPKPSG